MAWQEIVDYTVPSNTTSVTLDNFGTITKDDFVKIVATFVNASSSANSIDLTANSSTSSQYHIQTLGGDGNNVFVSRDNIARIDDPSPSVTAYSQSFLKISENDRLNVFTNAKRRIDSGVRVRFNYFTSSGTTFTSGITSLTFTGNQTNGIGTGSRIQIYRLAAEKVADITVTANTTQVDITGLDIKKGDEYLLVSDLVGNVATGYELMINDNTTKTNYFGQDIRATGSIAVASRENDARYGFSELNTRSIAYTHIKLSNIGAYTSQTYVIRNTGSSGVRLQNHFLSSTSEAITIITKLNVLAAQTNGIGTTSRFELYKLYEGGN